MIKSLNTLLRIEKLKGTGSQKLIMKELQDNWTPELEYILDVALNQFKPTHLNKILNEGDYLPVWKDDFRGDTFQQFKSIIDECINVKACTDMLRCRVATYIHSFTDVNHQDILGMIFTKNLNIGLGCKLVNKALSTQFLPTPEAQLADKDNTKIKSWSCNTLRVNVKYDGVRMISKYSPELGWTLYTRNFNEIDAIAMSNIIEQLNIAFESYINTDIPFFIDGELIAKDSIVAGENSSQARQSITGSVNKILKGNGKAGDDLNFTYVIFDIDSADVLSLGVGVTPYHRRRLVLEEDETHYHLRNSSNLSLATEWMVPNDNTGLALIKSIYDELISDGEEGVIIKNPTSVYTCGRNSNWVKMKEVLTADVKVVGCINGTGKYKDVLGAITVEFSTGQQVNVGTGISDLQRYDFWHNQHLLLGSIVEIQYNAKCKDNNGKESLFIPVFVKVRCDKTVADAY